MANDFLPHRLSASTGGRPIVISGTTAGSSNTVHVTGPSTTAIDEVVAYASNVTTSVITLTGCFGSIDDANEFIHQAIDPRDGLQPIFPGIRLSGDGSAGRAVRFYASAASVINITGGVNRYTPPT